MEIKKVEETGFCFGVRRAISILEKTAQEKGKVDTLGALVHNEEVLKQLDSKGVKVIEKPDEIQSKIVAISAHGVSPSVEQDLRSRGVEVVDTTCPSVKRAQTIAADLARNGFFVIVFGDASHPEVKGILGWAQGQGIAARDLKPLRKMDRLPGRIGILSQTTQIPEDFIAFIKDLLDLALGNGSEIRIVDTICQGVRKRQAASIALAAEVDLMLVVGSESSANSRRLFDLCSKITESHLINNWHDIQPGWLAGKRKIGVTSGTSASESTIEGVMKYLAEVNWKSVNSFDGSQQKP